MRRGNPGAGAGIAFAALAACSLMGPPPPTVVDISQWRTADGQPLTHAEFEALRNSCLPRRGEIAMDPRGAAASPEIGNPAFHPGGLGLMSETPLGGPSSGAPIAVDTTRVERGAGMPLEDCLQSKGLVKVE